MAEESIPQHRTCEICGEESPVGEFAFTAPDGRWIHAGPCFLEFGIIENTLAGSALREAIRRLCALHREKARAWKTVAEGERARIRRELVPEIRFSFAAQVAARGGGVTTEALELAQLSVIAALGRIVPGEG